MRSADQVARESTTHRAERLIHALTFIWRRCLMAALSIVPGAAVFFPLVAWSQDSPDQPVIVNFYVMDENQRPLARAQVEAVIKDHTITTAETNESGKASITLPAAGQYQIRVTKKEYLTNETFLQITRNSLEPIEVVVSHISLSKQEITVQGTSADPITQPSSDSATLATKQVKDVPFRPSTLKDALPLVPGVVRANDGSFGIAGYAENHSSMLINSVDVTDPSTGDFGLSVPIDTVETINVSEMPYLAQYGKLIAGLVAADTRRGGDKWSMSLNDPLPEFRIRSGHLAGLRDMSPRLNFGGPMSGNQLFVSEGMEYLVHKSPVRTLPFPDNETRFTAFNSFSQVDAALSPKHAITASFHFSPHTLRYDGLDSFNPQPVTPDADFHESTATITDRVSFAGGVLQSTIANTSVSTGVSPQGTADMLLTPGGNAGNYFSQQSRHATRFAWIENWTPRAIHVAGEHTLQIGTLLSYSEDEGQLQAHPVQIQDVNNRSLRRIDFTSGHFFALSDYAPAVYAQDHWILSRKLAVDFGARLEEQTITLTSRFAPRGGFVWTPSANKKTIFRGGVGIFYDSVPLGVYAFGSYPEQIITTYDSLGNIVGTPAHYRNVTDEMLPSRFPFIDRGNRSGNFAPYSAAWDMELEHVVSRFVTVRTKYLQSSAHDLLSLRPQISPQQDAFVLGSSGKAQTNQVEFTAKIGSGSDRQLFFSYVWQRAHGDVNDASSYTGNLPFPVIHQNITASLPYEVPDRFLLWGTYSLPRKIRLNPHIEMRSGFPYYPVNAIQQYILQAGTQLRFPRYLSLDLLASKDFQITKKHAIRISIPMTNLTNHFNALEVHSNNADPLYGAFFGNYPRRILLDFDFLN